MARVLCTIFSRQTKNRNWKAGRAAMPDSNIIQIDQNLFETKLDRLVTEKMTQILNAMLDAEADEITGAARYERKEGRKAYRAGHYPMTTCRKRTDHRPMDGHDPKCANLRALPVRSPRKRPQPPTAAWTIHARILTRGAVALKVTNVQFT